MIDACVVDASVGIKLFLIEELSDKADGLFGQLSEDPPARFYVPDLFYVECANILWKYVSRFGYPAESARQDVADLAALALVTVSTADLLEPALELALAYDITAYDACYATLARQLALPLVTCRRSPGAQAGGEWGDGAGAATAVGAQIPLFSQGMTIDLRRHLALLNEARILGDSRRQIAHPRVVVYGREAQGTNSWVTLPATPRLTGGPAACVRCIYHLRSRRIRNSMVRRTGGVLRVSERLPDSGNTRPQKRHWRRERQSALTPSNKTRVSGQV